MNRISQILNLGLSQPELDFVDIIPNRDTPLFIDPFAISLQKGDFAEKCNELITHFFQTAIDAVRSGDENKAKRLLNGLSEPNETCLGLTKQGAPSGRGVARKQANDLYDSLAQSQAAKTGILTELAEFDLFVAGIGSDKISDITTNIIRKKLICYTQEQCHLHNISLTGTYPTGRYWDIDGEAWQQSYDRMLVINDKRIILVPKFLVRHKMALNSQEFYKDHILNFIQAEEVARSSPLTRLLKNGERRPPSKEVLKAKYLFSKDFLATFAKANPKVLEDYKKFYSNIPGSKGTLDNIDFDENFNEADFANYLIDELRKINFGQEDASKYHTLIVGILSFILGFIYLFDLN